MSGARLRRCHIFCMASDGHKRKRAPCCRACPENAHGDRLAIGHIVCSFAIIEKKTMKPVPVDLDKDTRIAKREASSRIANFPPS